MTPQELVALFPLAVRRRVAGMVFRERRAPDGESYCSPNGRCVMSELLQAHFVLAGRSFRYVAPVPNAVVIESLMQAAGLLHRVDDRRGLDAALDAIISVTRLNDWGQLEDAKQVQALLLTEEERHLDMTVAEVVEATPALVGEGV